MKLHKNLNLLPKLAKFMFVTIPLFIVTTMFHALSICLLSHNVFEKAFNTALEGKQEHSFGHWLACYWNLITDNIFYYIFLLLICFTIVVVGYAVYNSLIKCGELSIEDKSCGRLSIVSLWSLINPAYSLRTFNLLHEFHHTYYEQVRAITDLPLKERDELSLEDGVVQLAVDSLLSKSKVILDMVLQDDVAVHIKLFESKLIRELCDISRAESHLRTYRRNPSKRELEKQQTIGQRSRNQIELFDTNPNQTLSQIADLKRTYLKNDRKGTPRINSAYNYILSPNNPKYFVCNDLHLAETKGLFYSNSDDWEKFYSSLAVFLILHPGGDEFKAGSTNRNPLGMFIVDSYSKGRFDRWRLRMVAGFLAHRFYDFFIAIRPPLKTSSLSEKDTLLISKEDDTIQGVYLG
jgi:hypothetical protein